MNGSSKIARYGMPLLVAVAYFAVMMPFGARLILHFPDERHYAYAGARMVETGEYLTPRTPDGGLRLKKPILPYWVTAAGFKVLGIGVPGFRLFTVVGAGAILLLTYALARTLGAPPRAALLAEFFLAGNPVFLHSSVVANPDIPLTLFMTMSAIGFATILESRETAAPKWAAWLAWIGVALAFLSKGVIAIIFAGFVLAFVGIVDRRRLMSLLRPAPIVCAVVLAASWYVYALALYPDEFVRQFFKDQVGDKVLRNTFGPLLAFPGYLIAGVVSFLFAPLLLLICFPRALLSPSIGSWPVSVKLFAAWCVVLAALFSIGGWVEVRYALPILPIVAVFFARAFEWLDGERSPRLSRAARRMLPAVAVIGLLTLIAGAAIDAGLAPNGEAAALIAVGVAMWMALVVAGVRTPGLAPFLLAATPALTIALLTIPLSRLVLPDLAEPLAERLARTPVTPERVLFVGDFHEASALRLYAGGADTFRYAQTLSADQLQHACVVMTDKQNVAVALSAGGFQVETLPAGWRRKLKLSDVLGFLWSGDLARTRAEHADKGYFAIAPTAVISGCTALAAGTLESPAG